METYAEGKRCKLQPVTRRSGAVLRTFLNIRSSYSQQSENLYTSLKTSERIFGALPLCLLPLCPLPLCLFMFMSARKWLASERFHGICGNFNWWSTLSLVERIAWPESPATRHRTQVISQARPQRASTLHAFCIAARCETCRSSFFESTCQHCRIFSAALGNTIIIFLWGIRGVPSIPQRGLSHDFSGALRLLCFPAL